MSTRDRILRIAGKLFYQEGVHTVGMERICQTSGITKPTLYHHFGSKDDLITAYIQASDHFIFSKYSEAVKASPAGALNQVLALLDEIERLMSKPQWNGCAFHRLASDLNAQREHPAYILAIEHKTRWRNWLIKLLQNNEIPNSTSIGRAIALIIDGAAATATLHNDRIYFEDAKLAILAVLDQNSAELNAII